MKRYFTIKYNPPITTKITSVVIGKKLMFRLAVC